MLKALALSALVLTGAGVGVAAQAQNMVADPAAPTAAAPSVETLALARRVAAHDDFLMMIEAAGTAQVADIEHGMGDLTPAEKVKFETIAKAKLASGMDRVTDVLATTYAARFTPDQLKGIAAFLETPAGQAYSERLISTTVPALQGLKHFDLRQDVLAESCSQIGKGCPAKAAAKPAGKE